MTLGPGTRYERVINDLIVLQNNKGDYVLSFVDEVGNILPSFFTFSIKPICDPVGDYDEMVSLTKRYHEIIKKPLIPRDEQIFVEEFDKLVEESYEWLLIHSEEFDRLGLAFNLQQSEEIFESALELGFKFGSQTILYWLYNRIAHAVESLIDLDVETVFGNSTENEFQRNSDLSSFIESTVIASLSDSDDSEVNDLIDDAA